MYDVFFILNPFENPALAEGYEDWYETPGHRADCLEKAFYRGCWLVFPLCIRSLKWAAEQDTSHAGFRNGAYELWDLS